MENARDIMTVVRQGPAATIPLEHEKQIDRKRLVNRLNYINFQDGTILINFRHAKYDRLISLDAKPLPCLGDRLDCRWSEPVGQQHQLASYSFENLFVVDGQRLVVVKPEVIVCNESGISFLLPERCKEVSGRKIRRYAVDTEIHVQLVQNGALFKGVLKEFNPGSFRIEISLSPPQTFHWLNAETPVNLILLRDGVTVYAGECRIIKQSSAQYHRSFVLQPTGDHIRRFKPKKYRSHRLAPIPLPNVTFVHPLIDRVVDLKVVDLSGSGFAVEEDEEVSVLLPGMIIPDLELKFAGNLSVKCTVQVVYRSRQGCDKTECWVKCGLAILDMDMMDHIRLLSLQAQAKDKNSYICNQVNMDDLWQFFFETGFVYPQKYVHIQANKEELKDIYNRLYTQNPSIARHFVYQDKGAILGHMAMMRFYQNSWMIHHHAASRLESGRAGLMVLRQISRFANDVHHLASAHMNFVFCYYRPENKFPSRVFGGVAKHIGQRKGCSVDGFAYAYIKRDLTADWQLNGPWSLIRSTAEDMSLLSAFYEQESGGLLINALDLEPDMLDSTDLTDEYARIGFMREKHLFSIKKDGHLKAVVMVNMASVCLNMSELTSSIKVIVVDGNDLTRQVLHYMLSMLLIKFNREEMPVLLYPLAYAKSNDMPYDKQYNLWVLDLQYLDQYFTFCEGLFRHV